MSNLYTIKQVAASLGVSHDTVTRWVKSGKVKAVKKTIFAGKTSPIFISSAEVDRLKKLQNESSKR
jgi:excisionase family DNA binding protein